MKKILLIIGVLALLSFAVEKFVTIRFTEPQLNYHWQNLQNIRAIADQSNLPHAQVKFIMSSIDSLQKDIIANGKLDSAVVNKK